jgi:hypothetical protein
VRRLDHVCPRLSQQSHPDERLIFGDQRAISPRNNHRVRIATRFHRRPNSLHRRLPRQMVIILKLHNLPKLLRRGVLGIREIRVLDHYSSNARRLCQLHRVSDLKRIAAAVIEIHH